MRPFSTFCSVFNYLLNCPFNDKVIFHLQRAFNVQAEPGGRIVGKRTGFLHVFSSHWCEGCHCLIIPDRPETPVAVGACLYSRVSLFYFWCNLNQKLKCMQSASVETVGFMAYLSWLFIYHSFGAQVTYICYDIHSSLLTFLKGLLHEILACFTWPTVLTLICDAVTQLLIFFKRETLNCFTF